MVEFGEQLKKAREEKGLSQQALAEQLYVTRQSISRWERGDRYPDLVTTKRIAQILELSIDSLLSDEDMPEVVEKSPVIESRTANNVSIALYMSILIYFCRQIAERAMEFFGLQTYKRFDEAPGIFGISNAEVIFIIIFSYALYHAIKETLTPKRIGIVLVTYYITYLLDFVTAMDWTGNYDEFHKMCKGGIKEFLLYEIELEGYFQGPAVLLLIASYFFFIRGSKHKRWVVIIMFASVWGIIAYSGSNIWIINMERRSVMENYKYTYGDAFIESIKLVRLFVFDIIFYILTAFQTLTLYRKRRTAMDLQEKDKN